MRQLKFFAPWVISFILGALLVAPLPAAGESGVRLVMPGEPPDSVGMWVDAETAKRMATDLRDGKALKDLLEAVQRELAAKDVQIESLLGQVVALKDQNRQNEIAVAIAKAIDVIRVDQLDRYERTLGRAVERIDSLENRLTWSQIMGILGPIGMAILLLF